MKYSTSDIVDVLSESTFDRMFNELLFVEKATAIQYHVKKFKEKYKYDPKTKTIEIDGSRYHVDLDSKNHTVPVYDVDGKKTGAIEVRHTSVYDSIKEPIIILGPSFFKLKKSKHRDALLRHELGHIKYASSNIHSKTAEPKPEDKKSAINKKVAIKEIFIDRILKGKSEREWAINKLRSNNEQITDEAIRKKISALHKDAIEYEHNYLDSATDISDLTDAIALKKIARDVYAAAKKYEKGGHANAREYIADRYAANKTSEKDLEDALNESYKIINKYKYLKSNAKAELNIRIRKDLPELMNRLHDINKDILKLENLRKTIETNKGRYYKMKDRDGLPINETYLNSLKTSIKLMKAERTKIKTILNNTKYIRTYSDGTSKELTLEQIKAEDLKSEVVKRRKAVSDTDTRMTAIKDPEIREKGKIVYT